MEETLRPDRNMATVRGVPQQGLIYQGFNYQGFNCQGFNCSSGLC